MNVILIPAYKPDEELLKLIDQLHSRHLSILVVDDGSGEDYKKIFEKASEKAVVLHNSKNLGKGATLKHGMRELRNHYPDCTHFITVDADGQHRIEDICKVHEELEKGASFVLTMRDLQGKIPAKSKFGNLLSRWIYTLLTGHYFQDNQSGLRGFAVEHIDWMLKVAGDKYDYEINVLYYADMQKITITTLPIETVYIDGNRSTHFSPVADTLWIYRRLFGSAKGTLITTLLYEIFMLVITIFWGYDWCFVTIPAAGIICAGIGTLMNGISFRNVDYKSHGRMWFFAAGVGTYNTVMCTLAGLLCSELPLILVFNILLLVRLPIQYLVYQLCAGRNRRH